MSTYTSPEFIKEELRATISFSSDTYPSVQTVNRWIDETEGYIDSLGASVSSQTTHTESIDYSGSEILTLKHSPIISVGSLNYNTSSLGETETFELRTENVDYFVYKESGEILLNFAKFQPNAGFRKIKVVYDSGYEDVPMIVQMLATKLVAQRVMESLISNSVNEGSSGGSISVGSINITEPANFGVGSFKQLKTDIESLKKELLKGTGIYRYTAG